jgi:hypothetical protein
MIKKIIGIISIILFIFLSAFGLLFFFSYPLDCELVYQQNINHEFLSHFDNDSLNHIESYNNRINSNHRIIEFTNMTRDEFDEFIEHVRTITFHDNHYRNYQWKSEIKEDLQKELDAHLSLKHDYNTNNYQCHKLFKHVYHNYHEIKQNEHDKLKQLKLDTKKCLNKILSIDYNDKSKEIIDYITTKKGYQINIYTPPNFTINGYNYIKYPIGSDKTHLDILTSPDLKLHNIFLKPAPINCCKFGECPNPCPYVIVLDTGISLVDGLKNHIDGRYTIPPNDYDDQIGHGTFCASMINSDQVGINSNTFLISAKLMKTESKTDIDYIKYIFSSLEELGHLENSPCNPNRKCIITMSFVDQDSQGTSILKKLIDDILNTNSFILFSSAGNQNDDACLYAPGNNQNVISIGSVQRFDNGKFKRSTFSNYGKCVDFWFMGENIVALSNVNGQNAQLTGTSMTNPTAAAIISVYLMEKPNASITEVKQYLENISKSCVINELDETNNNLLLSMDPNDLNYKGKYPIVSNCVINNNKK